MSPNGPSLPTVLREWGRLGCIGFGGPPTHIALLRDLCVEQRGWLSPEEFEDAIAACNLLPGPSSTQLSIYCAWRVRGWLGAIVGGLAFICPGLVMILALSAVFLASSPPRWIAGAAAGAGAGVAAIALQAGLSLAPTSRKRAHSRFRWTGYVILGGIAAATIGPWLVLVLLACGLVELAASVQGRALGLFLVPALAVPAGGLGALAWVALKIGVLSYGGGFVIIPLMQSDAVHRYHWLTDGQFLNAVALGQITPGPIVLTVAVVGYAARGLGGGLLATAIAFTPSFAFILLGGPHFHALRSNERARAFLDGAGPAAIGAILGVSIPLALALDDWWQLVLLAVAGYSLFVLRRGVVFTLLALAVAGSVLVSTHAV